MSHDLPQGWATVELENHVYIAGRIGWRGLKRSEYTKTGPLFLAVKNILPNGQIDFAETDHLSEQRYDESPEIQLRLRDILLTKDGTIGKVGMIDSLPGQTTVNSSILVVRPNDELLLDRYLFHYLRGPQFQEIAHERITGSAIPHLFQKDIKKLRAVVPPANEQRRIVTELEKLLGKVDACQQRLARIPVLLKRFRQSVLAAASSGRLTAVWREENPGASVAASLWAKATASDNGNDLPLAWVACRVGDVMRLKNGFAFKSTDYTDSGVPLVRISNIQDGNVSLDESAKLPPEKANWNFAVEKGDLLVAMSGATTGKFGVYDGDERCMQNQRVGNIKILDLNEVLLGYRNIYLQSLKRRIEEEAYGGAQPNISPAKIEALPFACPPLAEQHEIVRRVERLFALADQIEARYTKAKAHVEKLTQSILAKAFRGELVAQDPNDESAESLLRRIHQQRQNGKKA
jgi:type I restriction enzyme S subunit